VSSGCAWADQPLPDADKIGLLDGGVPREAIRADRTLDLDMLRVLGWEVSSAGSLTPPDDEHHRDLAQRNAQAAIDGPNTRRGYR
jgi:hypothetical protein